MRNFKMATSMSKADYLKRYLEPEKKKRKKKPNSKLVKKKKNICIIDEDVGFKDLDKRKDSSDEEQDKPLVYAEDGLSLIQQNEIEKEKIAASKWKTVKKENSLNDPEKDKSDSDYSPVRRNAAESDSDFSPVRRQRKDSSSDYSPQRGKDSDTDYSPPRQRRRHDSDNSDYDDIPRDTSHSKRHIKRERSSSPDEVTTKKSGLQSADSLREENKLRKKQQDDKFRRMEASVSGKGQQTIYRNKDGKRRNIAEENALKKEEEEKKLKEDKVFKEWGKGITQTKEKQLQLEGDLHEMSKPLARYQDDKDLDNLLKNQLRAEDPMLAYISKKSTTASKKKERPKYKGPPPPPNRFNIQPGYRWDGVDRSNGFEKKRFIMLAGKKSLAEDAYKWSVEDM